MSDRRMHLGLFVLNTGHHIASWRHPGTKPATQPPFAELLKVAKTAERGLFDVFFLADSAAVPDMPPEILARTDRMAFIEPATTAAAIAAGTDKIGLVITQNTTYDHPYYVARRVLSIDHISGGRMGCNFVTGVSRGEARNFGHDDLPPHAERYERAAEFCDVAVGLWDSYDPDAYLIDRASGRFMDPQGIHVLDHRGKHFAVRGPLNVGPSPQGRPVVVQAGGSEAGRDLAARTAEMVYSVQGDLAEAVAFADDIRGRLVAAGRAPDALKIMPGLLAFVGRTRAEAEDKFGELQSLLDPTLAVAFLQMLVGRDVDLSRYRLDEPLPQDLTTNFGSTQLKILQQATRTKGMTLAELARHAVGARGHWMVCGTAADIADQMEERFRAGAADGFNLMPATIPGGVEDFVDMVVPELQRRGLFRTRYEGDTLRDHLGLPRPVSRWAVPMEKRA